MGWGWWCAEDHEGSSCHRRVRMQHMANKQWQGRPWVETVHCNLDGWVQARDTQALFVEKYRRAIHMPPPRACLGQDATVTAGSNPALQWACRLASCFQQARQSRPLRTHSLTSSTTASPCALFPPALCQAPAALKNFPGSVASWQESQSPCQSRCYGPGNHDTSGWTEWEDNRTTRRRGSPTLRATEVQEGVLWHLPCSGFLPAPRGEGVSFPDLLDNPPWRGKPVPGCLTGVSWRGSFSEAPL